MHRQGFHGGLTQSSRIPDPADGFKLEEFISAAREKLIMRALNNGISSDTARYSKVTFDYLIVPYTLFAVGSGLKALFIGTGRPFYIFVPSAIVNLLIYMPLGLAAKYVGVKIRYTEFLQATIAVFLLDFILSAVLLQRKGYKPLRSAAENRGAGSK